MLRLLKNAIEQGASKVWERHNLLLSETENNKTRTSSLTPLFDTDKWTLRVYHVHFIGKPGISPPGFISVSGGFTPSRVQPPPLQVFPENN